MQLLLLLFLIFFYISFFIIILSGKEGVGLQIFYFYEVYMLS